MPFLRISGSSPPRSSPKSCENSIGTPYDPVPRFARELRRERKLTRTDLDVLIELLKLTTNFRDSVWVTKAYIAKELGCCPRTVQSSYNRLQANGLIRQHELNGPDPDEPRNRTGWRIYFLWLNPSKASLPGPDRRPSSARKGGGSTAGGGGNFLPLPQEKKEVSSPPGQKVASNSSSKLTQEGTTTTRTREAVESSSSFSSTPLPGHPVDQACLDFRIRDESPSPSVAGRPWQSPLSSQDGPAIDQVLLAALVVRLGALQGCTPPQATTWIGSQLAEHGGHGHDRVLGWLDFLMDPAKAGKVRNWIQYLGATLARKVQQPIPPRAAPPAKPPSELTFNRAKPPEPNAPGVAEGLKGLLRKSKRPIPSAEAAS